MDIKEFAKLLDGREYMHEITEEEEQLAKELGYVVVFGYSDDCIEFAGFINDELGCYEGRKFALLPGQRICPCDYNPIKNSKEISAIWGADGYSWVYKTEIPHETFDIFEFREKYCRGIVFKWPFKEGGIA